MLETSRDIDVSRRRGDSVRRRSLSFVRVIRRAPLAAAGVLVLIVAATVALFAPWVAPYDPKQLFVGPALQSPSWEHLCGTDNLGRDVLSRLIFGGRVSLSVSCLSVILGAFAGSTLGVVSGYLGGRVDFVAQRLVEILQAFPLLVLALVIVATLGASFQNVVAAIAIVMIPGYSRLARSATIQVRELPYVTAATSAGASQARIMVRHILPNIAALLIVLVTTSLGSAILVETSLSFLGLSASPTDPSLGAMLSLEGRAFFEQAPWLAIFPGVAISIVVLGVNLAGDGLRDLWDPTLRSK